MNRHKYPNNDDCDSHRASHNLTYLHLGLLAHSDQETTFFALIRQHLTHYAAAPCRKPLLFPLSIEPYKAINGLLATHEKFLWPYQGVDKSAPAT